MVQDLPPVGGYGPVQYRRNLPPRGFRPSHYLFAMGALCAYGFWEAGKGIKEQRELAREKVWSRIHLIPMLQAEVDRDTVRRQLAADAREKELMKDVPGWKNGSVYNSDRYVRPNYVVTPSQDNMKRTR
ncbi:GRIM-19 [Ascobolus immersus RN42]|uniref:NADH dehydrogenase [ubiquinone] 1 alpha subcomplex subunit 13 n=1 Tax=Ascobolus immersus RN42 TaxID=1160509 RepID=A0A3N4I178_ASCIM|nr:GRIM-19 [Ascobolus immersus RN42]